MSVRYDFLSSLMILMVVIDPLGNVPIFVTALKSVRPSRRVRLILRECLIAFFILFFFMIFGKRLLSLMRVSELSLQIGGAVVLMLIAIRMVFPPSNGVFGVYPEGEPFVVPLAVPAIAGPSASATVLTIFASDPSTLFRGTLVLFVAIFLSAVVFIFAERLQNYLGEKATGAFERLMGLILIVVSVEMILNGIQTYVEGWRLPF